MKNPAFEALDEYRRRGGLQEIELPPGTVLFHAGDADFKLSSNKTLWTAQDRHRVLTYQNRDLFRGFPRRLIYELTALRTVKLAVFPSFGNQFCEDFCSAHHEVYAEKLTTWGASRLSIDELSPLDGIKDGWEILIFNASEVFEITGIDFS